MSEHGHVVVVGGGDAGLLAARVLAGHFERVTVVERDRSAEPRTALLAAVANVRVLEGCEVEGLVADGDRRRVAGVAVRWRGEEPRRWGVHGEPRRTSILADREQGQPLEWDVRNAVIQRRGSVHGIPTPISDVVVPLLAAASDGPG